MARAIHLINDWGQQALSFAWPMLWQSSLLIFILLFLDLALRKRAPATLRYALWLVLLFKLVLPPSLALPSGLAWWLRSPAPSRGVHGVVTIQAKPGSPLDTVPAESDQPTSAVPSRAVLSFGGWALMGWTSFGLCFLGWMLAGTRKLASDIGRAAVAPAWLEELLHQTRPTAGVRCAVGLKLMGEIGTPTVCGLRSPTILLPRVLLELLAPDQMRAVLLHELAHIRRRDSWVNCAQALLQCFYFWHPLLWLANVRIRRVREEAVDDAVMLALGDRSGTYAQTLLEVAKMALPWPLTGAGPIGILESKSVLRKRIERLMDVRPATKGMTLVSLVSAVAFAAMALPMGEAPPSAVEPSLGSGNPWPDARFNGYGQVSLEPQFLAVSEKELREAFPSGIERGEPLLVTSNEMTELGPLLQQARAAPFSAAEPLSIMEFSGGVFHWRIGGVTNNNVNYVTRSVAGKTIVMGAEVAFLADHTGWIPLEFSVVPWSRDSGIRCQMRLGPAGDLSHAQAAEVTIPKGGALLWATAVSPAQFELVLLCETSGHIIEDQRTDSTSLDPEEPAPATPERTPLGRSPAGEASIGTQGTSIFQGTNGVLIKHGATVLRADKVSGVISNSQLIGVLAEGNVRVQQGDQLMKSDQVRISRLIQPTNGEAFSPVIPQQISFSAVGQPVAGTNPGPSRVRSQNQERVTELLKTDVVSLKLRLIRVPQISFNQLPLRDVLECMNNYIPENRFGEKAFSFTFEQLPAGMGDLKITIEPALKDVSLADLVDAVAKVSPIPLRYSVDASGVHYALRATRRRGRTQINIRTRFVTLPEEACASVAAFFQGTNASGSSPGNFSAVLSPPQSAVVLKTLESNARVDVFRNAGVTTLNGGRIELQVVDLKTVVTNLNPKALTLPGISSKGSNGVYETSTNPFGPMLDGVVTILDDDNRIRLDTDVRSTEFLGYDQPKAKVSVYVDGKRSYVTPPLPHFREAKMKASEEVPDGYTLLLSLALNDQVSATAAKLPRLEKKRLLVLMTPVLIDPAGKRLHPEN